MSHTVEIDLHGSKVTIETGKMAKQANGAVVVRSGDSVVLVTACANAEPKPGANFFPLTVDYREYTYSAGQFPRRLYQARRPPDGKGNSHQPPDRPPDPPAVPGRLCASRRRSSAWCSRPIRSAIPSTLAIIGAGAALAISDIPFEHVLGGVRVGMVDGSSSPTPPTKRPRHPKLNIVVAGTEEAS